MSASQVLLVPRERSAIRLGVVIAALFGIVLVHQETLASLVSIWMRSETFAHCFVIAPISAFLVWQRRDDLRGAPKHTSVVGLVAVVMLTAGWFVASSVRVQFAQQLTFVLLIPATVLALLGTEATKRIAMPLVFLIFAVPFGEALIPGLMEFTATFTVTALQLTGIPVLREGYYFSIPSGDFEVATACSGIRYLIACFTLGVLYAQLAFTSWRKKAIFIAASLIAPIIANGIRAYLIVLLAHLSGMTLAVGVDHLIYGWLFFGLLVAVMFWVGGLFRDPPISTSSGMPRTAPLQSSEPPRFYMHVGVAVLVVGIVAAGPVLLHARINDANSRSTSVAELPTLSGAWVGPAMPTTRWQREAQGFDRESRGLYAAPSGAVEMNLLTCCRQTRDADTIGSLNSLIDSKRWQTIESDRTEVEFGGGDFPVAETVLRAGGVHRVLWHWYVVDGTDVTSDWRAKLLEAWALLVHNRSDTTIVLLSAESAAADTARSILTRFARDNGDRLRPCLGSRGCSAK